MEDCMAVTSLPEAATSSWLRPASTPFLSSSTKRFLFRRKDYVTRISTLIFSWLEPIRVHRGIRLRGVHDTAKVFFCFLDSAVFMTPASLTPRCHSLISSAKLKSNSKMFKLVCQMSRWVRIIKKSKGKQSWDTFSQINHYCWQQCTSTQEMRYCLLYSL